MSGLTRVYHGEGAAVGEALTLLASAARLVTAGANGTAVAIGRFKRLLVLLNVTASLTDAGDTLNVYVDVTPDGSTWLNAIHFTQKAGNTAAIKEWAVLDPTQGAATVTDVTADAASGVVRPSLFGVQARVRWVIVEGVGAGVASHTFSVVAYGQ